LDLAVSLLPGLNTKKNEEIDDLFVTIKPALQVRKWVYIIQLFTFAVYGGNL